MSDQVRLKAKLAADEELNGLDAWADALLNDPPPRLFVYGWVTRVEKKHDDVHNRDVPTVAFSRIEVEGELGDVPDAVRKRMAEIQSKRLKGEQEPLDFEATEPRPKPPKASNEPGGGERSTGWDD